MGFEGKELLCCVTVRSSGRSPPFCTKGSSKRCAQLGWEGPGGSPTPQPSSPPPPIECNKVTPAAVLYTWVSDHEVVVMGSSAIFIIASVCHLFRFVNKISVFTPNITIK